MSSELYVGWNALRSGVRGGKNLRHTMLVRKPFSKFLKVGQHQPLAEAATLNNKPARTHPDPPEAVERRILEALKAAYLHVMLAKGCKHCLRVVGGRAHLCVSE
jgi:hypothetical protein